MDEIKKYVLPMVTEGSASGEPDAVLPFTPG